MGIWSFSLVRGSFKFVSILPWLHERPFSCKYFFLSQLTYIPYRSSSLGKGNTFTRESPNPPSTYTLDSLTSWLWVQKWMTPILLQQTACTICREKLIIWISVMYVQNYFLKETSFPPHFSYDMSMGNSYLCYNKTHYRESFTNEKMQERNTRAHGDATTTGTPRNFVFGIHLCQRA